MRVVGGRLAHWEADHPEQLLRPGNPVPAHIPAPASEFRLVLRFRQLRLALAQLIFDFLPGGDIANEGGENIAPRFLGKMAERDLDRKLVPLPVEAERFNRAPIELFCSAPQQTLYAAAMRLAQTLRLKDGNVISHQPRRGITENT